MFEVTLEKGGLLRRLHEILTCLQLKIGNSNTSVQVDYSSVTFFSYRDHVLILTSYHSVSEGVICWLIILPTKV